MLNCKRRKKELDVMEKKMRHEMEEETSKQKEEMINKARTWRLKRSSSRPRTPLKASGAKLKKIWKSRSLIMPRVLSRMS